MVGSRSGHSSYGPFLVWSILEMDGSRGGRGRIHRSRIGISIHLTSESINEHTIPKLLQLNDTRDSHVRTAWNRQERTVRAGRPRQDS
jgi:hypothetical protein